jgi:hypothetical protein
MHSYGGLLLLGSANMADRWLQTLSLANTYHQQSGVYNVSIVLLCERWVGVLVRICMNTTVVVLLGSLYDYLIWPKIITHRPSSKLKDNSTWQLLSHTFRYDDSLSVLLSWWNDCLRIYKLADFCDQWLVWRVSHS